MPKNPKPPTVSRSHKKIRKQKRTVTPKHLTRFLMLRKTKPAGFKPRRLTGSFRLFSDSMSLLRQYWRLFIGITAVYLLLSLTLVGILGSGLEIAELKQAFTEEQGGFGANVALFGFLLASTGTTASEGGAAYQTVVVVLVSLATIWALRQVLSGRAVGVRDAFYKGMYPLVPFIFVLLFVCVLFIPALIGSFILSAVFAGGLAVSFIEQLLWAFVIFALIALTLFWLSTFVFSMYVVTLPDTRPLAAIKTAKKISVYYRWAILRKLLFLPIALIVIAGLIMLPLISLAPVAVQWTFVVLSMFALVFAHTYMYSLYKELI